jgi:phospholipase C
MAPNIQHVFVLMLENRSLDHLLGLSQLQGTDAVTGQPTKLQGVQAGSVQYSNSYNSQTYTVPAGPAPWCMPIDPGHEFTDVLEQLCGPGAQYTPGSYPPVNNAGFVADYAVQPKVSSLNDIMACYTTTGLQNQLPVLTALAQAFAVCDMWFSSMPGPTWPNRFFLEAGSSGGLDHSPGTGELIEAFETSGYAFQNGTIFNALSKRSIPWRIYTGTPYPISYAVKGTRPWNWYTGTFSYYRSFASDVAGVDRHGNSNYAAKYTFIEPDYGNFLSGSYLCGTSQHPVDDVTRGEYLLMWTYQAIRNSPLWPNSLLIVTWDEHGGFYDHVPPGPAPAPGDKTLSSVNNKFGFTFNQYGVRVPAVVISPFVPPNLIDHRTYDHASALATIEVLFNLPSLTNRDAQALNVLSLLTATTPNPGPALPAPANSGVTGCDYPPKPSDQWPPAWMMRLGGGLAGMAAGIGLTFPSPEEAAAPLHGNMAGFLYAAMRRDLASTPPGQRLRRLARFRKVQTVGDAREYLQDVVPRLAKSAVRPVH